MVQPAPSTALKGLTVLDMTQARAGPICVRQLADWGANVIKIERPGTGDQSRRWGPPFLEGESAYYLCCNRNKRSITVDLKQPRGVQLIRELAADPDGSGR